MHINKYVVILSLVFTSSQAKAAIGDMPAQQAPQPATNEPTANAVPPAQQQTAAAPQAQQPSPKAQAQMQPQQNSPIPNPSAPPPQGNYQPPMTAPPAVAQKAPESRQQQSPPPQAYRAPAPQPVARPAARPVASTAPRPSFTKKPSEGSWGVGVVVGTLGYGIDLTYGISDRVNVRAAFRTVEESQEINEDDIDYNVNLDIQAGLLAIDWHPFYNGLRVTGGLFLGGFNFQGDATCQQVSCDISGTSYNSATVGTLSLEIDSGATNPYVGLGFGNAAKGTGFGFAVDLGVMMTTDGTVDLSSSSPSCSPGTPCGNDLQAQEDELQEQFKIYPVISLGLTYTF